jgi:hypothetical protein
MDVAICIPMNTTISDDSQLLSRDWAISILDNHLIAGLPIYEIDRIMMLLALNSGLSYVPLVTALEKSSLIARVLLYDGISISWEQSQIYINVHRINVNHQNITHPFPGGS